MTATTLDNLTHSTDAVEHHAEVDHKALFGFWIFVLSDFIVFASLFATYAVLHNNTFGDIGIHQVAALPQILTQSLVFITSSFAYGLAILAMKRKQANKLSLWLGVSFLLGLIFLSMEYQQFSYLLTHGHSWKTSAFLSSYFTLLGLQFIHVAVGLLWMLILMIQFSKKGLIPAMQTRFACLGIFWDFLVIVWFFILAIVYLMGAV